MNVCGNDPRSGCRATDWGNTGASAKTRYLRGSSASVEVSMSLDSGATLIADAEQAKRAIEGGTMVRRRFQRGSLFKRGKREKICVARLLEDIINPDGTIGTIHPSL